MFFIWPICFSVLFFMAFAFFIKRKKPDISIRMRWVVLLFLILTSTLLELMYLRASGDVDMVQSIQRFTNFTIPVSSVIFAVFFLLRRVAERKRQIIFKTIFGVLLVLLLADILHSYYSRSIAIYCRPAPNNEYSITDLNPYPNDLIDRLFGLKLQPRFYKDYDDCSTNLKCCTPSVGGSN